MSLEKVRSCCHLLEANKITDRKHGFQQLKEILNNDGILQRLQDEPSMWDQLFQAGVHFFVKEAQKVEEDERKKEDATSAVKSNRDNMKRQAVAAPKMILKKACLKKPSVSCHMVVELVMKVLNRSRIYLYEHFAKYMIEVVQQYLLYHMEYYSKVKQETWKELTKICTRIYGRGSPSVNKIAIVNVLEGIVDRCQQRGEHEKVMAILQPIPAFLRSALQHEGFSTQHGLRGAILSLLLTFSSHMAVEWRRVVGELGEDAWDAVLAMWEDRSSAQQTKLLKYLNLIILVHHPQHDGVCEEGSQVSFDNIHWKRCLCRLYQIICDQIMSKMTECSISGSSPDLFLCEDTIALMARLCNQLFKETNGYGVLEVTQVGMTQISTQASMGNKRRKLEVGLEPFCQVLREQGTQQCSIPIYQILYELITSYGGFLDESRISLLFSIFSGCHAECKDPQIQALILKCINALAKRMVTAENFTIANQWTSVWNVTLRILHTRQCEEQGYALLNTLIMHMDLADTKLIRIICQGDINVSEYSLVTLAVLVAHWSLPKRLKSSGAVFKEESQIDVRAEMINWLLPLPEEKRLGHSSLLAGYPLPSLLSSVLIALTLRDPREMKDQLLSMIDSSKTQTTSSSMGFLQELEQSYLLSSFSCGLPKSVSEKGTSEVMKLSSSSLLDNIKGKIMLRLENICDQICENEVAEDPMGYFTSVSHLAGVVVRLMHLDMEERLKPKLLKMLEKIEDHICKFIKESEPGPVLYCALSELEKLFDFHTNHMLLDIEGFVPLSHVKETLHSLVSSRTRKVLLDLVKKHLETIRGTVNGETLGRSNSKGYHSDDEFDLDMDDSSGSHMALASQNLDDFDVSETTSATTSHTQDPEIFVNPDKLSSSEKCVLKSVECLARLSDLVPPSEDAPIVDVLEDLKDNTPKLHIWHLPLVFHCVSTIFKMTFEEYNVSDCLLMIGKACQKYADNPYVASAVLKLLTDLCSLHSSNLEGSLRDNLIILIKAFAKKQKIGAYGYPVLLQILKINLQLTMVDPERTWSQYEIDGDAQVCEVYHFLRSPRHVLRVTAAQGIGHLFGSSMSKPVSIVRQEKVFRELYQAGLEALTIQANMAEYVIPDEESNRVASLLLALGITALWSPFTQHQAIFALCHTLMEKRLNSNLVAKLISRVAESKDCSLASYMELHLPYIAAQWLQHHYNLSDFPPDLLSCSDIDTMFQKYVNKLLPTLFVHDQNTAIASLASACHLEVEELLENNFPSLIARVLPYVAGELSRANFSQISRSEVAAAHKRYKCLEKIFGQERFAVLMANHVGAITLNLLTLAHDRVPVCPEHIIVEPVQLYFVPEIIKDTLEYLATIFSHDTPLASILCDSGLQQVLEGVQGCLAKVHDRQTAHSAHTFTRLAVDLFLPGLGTLLGNSSLAVIRILLHSLLQAAQKLAQDEPVFCDKFLEMLLQVLEVATAVCPEMLSYYISTLVSGLIPLSSKCSSAKNSCVKALDILLGANSEEIVKAMAQLPPFPSQGDFKHLEKLQNKHNRLRESQQKTSLKQDILSILQVPFMLTTAFQLTHLLQRLKVCKNEIRRLNRIEDGDNVSLLHRFLHRLVKLAFHSHEKVCKLACDCLGELGPVPLNTSVFHIEEDRFGAESSPELSMTPVLNVLKLLNRYVVSEKFTVVEVASACLRATLATPQGFQVVQGLLKTNEQLYMELVPFLPKKKPKNTSVQPDYEEFMNVDEDELWLKADSHQEWVCRLASTLLSAGCGSPFLHCLQPLCAVEDEFSAAVLPYIIHSALETDIEGMRRRILSRHISAIFEELSSHLKNNSYQNGGTAPKEAHLRKSSLKILLNVVNYLRFQMPLEKFSKRHTISPWEKNLWLDVSYLQLAKGALYCGAHFSSCLFLEIYCEFLRQEEEECSQANGSSSNISTPVHRVGLQSNQVSNLFLQVYSSLGDVDGVEGCVGGGGGWNWSSWSTRCQHRGQWTQALAIHDAANSLQGAVEGLKHLGWYGTLSTYLSGTPAAVQENMQEAWWECCWRLGKWEEAMDSNETVLESHQMHIYSLFQAIHLRDLPAISNHIEAAKVQILQQLKMVSVESTSCLYPLLSNLQIISEMESVTQNLSSLDSRTVPHMVKNALELWQLRDLTKTENFEHREPILAARVAFLNALQNFDTDDALLQVLLLKSEFIRKTRSKSLDGCESVLVQASKLNVSSQLSSFRCLEIAHIAKARGDLRQASHILENLLQDLESVESNDHEAHCQALSIYGEVLTKTRAKPPRTIITNYMERALTIMEEKGAGDEKSSNNLVAAYYQLAVFSEEWYLHVKEHLKSDTAKIKMNNIKQSKIEAQSVAEVITRCKDEVERKELESKRMILNKNVALDQSYLQDLLNKKKEYLNLALKNYLKCLATAEDHDVHVYRVLALWFEHSSSNDVNNLVCESIHGIKSHKWVPLLYQLVARLTDGQSEEENSLFQSLLNDILEKVCQEHPHHGLPVLLALAHAHADDVKHKVAEEGRVRGAKQLVQKLKRLNIKDHVSEMETVCQAYLSLANWCMSKDKGKMGSQTPLTRIPSNQGLSKLRNLNYTGALTRPLQVQASGQYNPPCIATWDGTITLVGGINAPKKLTVITEDGVKSHELLKGRDDTRQDAVLEQVFGIVNKLLKKESESKSRRLSVRTYMVVPLSQRSGLIQWCENTQTFGDYLIGSDSKGGAHKMYCPTDWPATTCRKNLQQSRPKSREEKEKVFKNILSHFRPVFRHFFYENYPRPDVWYKKRLAYTNSVATNSMVGYILGLGDRHVQNILVDKQSAELIHIDLGIAFEFGKILPTPETVPFRLSQDIVDGLGVSGVEGVFRHGCEVTLQVLRNYAALLVTVVEVLRHDPLYTWTLSPQQIAKLQTVSATSHQTLESNSVASMAERVVLRVQQKLAGLEEGQVWTVPEQVTSLINQATDIGNLSQLFAGWQPYL